MSKNKEHQKEANKLRKRLSKRKKFIISAVVVVLIISAGFVWYVIYGQKDNLTKTPEAKTLDQINTEAKVLIDSGNTSAAKTEYVDAIKVTTSPEDKYFLLQNLSNVYLNDGEYDQALVVALEMDTADPSSVSDASKSLIASIYAAKGDKQQAIKYYQEAIGLVDPTYDWASQRISTYQTKINELNGVNN